MHRLADNSASVYNTTAIAQDHQHQFTAPKPPTSRDDITDLAPAICVARYGEAMTTHSDSRLKHFGQDALRFVNSPLGRQLHLRSVNAKVVQPGLIRVGEPNNHQEATV